MERKKEKMAKEIKVQRTEGRLKNGSIGGKKWRGGGMQHEVERERNMALWRGRGRGTVHSKVWLLSRLSGSDFDVSVFFGLTSRLTGPQELPSPCLIKTFQTSVTMAPPGFCSLLKKGQKSITRVTAAFLTPLTSQTESKLRTGRNLEAAHKR